MRSSNKSRSRNKSSNRGRSTVGNIVNRVFDSAGPEGRVRGTPAQIIEKYQALARDAQLSNDRVAAENFQQHAEHYLRMLNEAMREQAERQAQDQRNRPQNGHANGQDGSDQQDGDDQDQDEDRNERSERQVSQEQAPRQDNRPRRGEDRPERQSRPEAPQAAEVLDAEPDSGLVDTPESRASAEETPPAPRKPRGRPRRSAKTAEDQPASGDTVTTPIQ
ncbi:DUF4167 domain-containing protein [Halovulum dunhuangense]|uniref:DUF4167 domain-containing protein n=1 Tax=Halovulum dunhuangense TaxID=1505036 RepID=A0A849L3S8_9RHOB|nr:DUF4167 domain-containing protein [Halovulum dunhuangense]NNU80811.1 DUF4167 domain-containing protein [Halovulum dunhuangense]